MMLIQQMVYAHALKEGMAHLAAIVYQLGEESQNYICTLSAQARLQIARIAVGDKAITNIFLCFFTSESSREVYIGMFHLLYVNQTLPVEHRMTLITLPQTMSTCSN